MTMDHRSLSQLNTFSQCGQAYFLKRVANVGQAPAAWTIQGVAVHAAIELYELSERRVGIDDLLATYTAKWDQMIGEAREREPNLSAWQTGGSKGTQKDIDDRYLLGQDQIRSYVNYGESDPLRVWRLPDTGQPASEVKFLEDFGGVNILGYVDLIMENPKTGDLLVRDIKTGTRKPSGWNQLAVYKWGIWKKYGRVINWGHYWMPKYGGPLPPIYLGDIPLKRVEAWFQMMDFSESNGVYLPNIGDHCRICDVRRHCPDAGGVAPEGIYHLGT